MVRIQKIGHIGLFCRDIKKMTEFYTDVLEMKVSDVNERGMVFLRFGADHHSFNLVPMPEEMKEKGDGPQALQHIALEVADLEELKKIKKHLQSKGVKGHAKVKHEGPGNNYVYDFADPEGNNLQFFCGMDQIGWDGKSRPKEQWNRFEEDD
ncbi:MAG: hypothetical protein A2X89_10155 [Deltaproteobacteria bacterium GWD2_55_8]|nr:MAG: hypothetical protein A2X89_10155 [Deltaproteobacteria bacterium GWD2_55_8]